jgi:membrane protein DedA with SNARE-associated domain
LAWAQPAPPREAHQAQGEGTGSARILTLLIQAAVAAGPVVRHLHQMSVLERVWKYTALGASSIVFEEANPIFGGIAVRQGRLDLLAVIAAIAVGTWVASVALYLVGRWRIDWVRRRFPRKQLLLDGALEIVRRHPWRASLAIRFAYWLRIPLPIACGAARLPLSLYLLASGISCWLWSAAFVLLGFWASNAALRALAFTRRNDVRLGIVAALLLVILHLVTTRRRRFAERTAEMLTGEHIQMTTTAERASPRWPTRDPGARNEERGG